MGGTIPITMPRSTGLLHGLLWLRHLTQKPCTAYLWSFTA